MMSVTNDVADPNDDVRNDQKSASGRLGGPTAPVREAQGCPQHPPGRAPGGPDGAQVTTADFMMTQKCVM